MGFIDRVSAALLARPFATTNGHGPAVESKGVTLDPRIAFHGPNGVINSQLIWFPGVASSESELAVRDTAYAAAAYCHAAIRYRAQAVSEPPLMVTEEDEDGNEEWLPRHSLDSLLDDPAPDYDMGELLYRTQVYTDVTGSALWAKDADRGGRVGRLTPYSGREFTVEQTRQRIRGRFTVATAQGDKPLGPEQVIYLHEPNPDDWMRGLSLVDVALSWLNLGQQARATTGDILRNALFPSVIVQPDKDWNPAKEEFDRYKAEIKTYARRDKKGDPLVLLGGGSATSVGARLKDLIPGDILDRVEATVSSVFGIPAVVLQFLVGLSNSPWSQMAEARRMCYEDTIARLWRRYEKQLTRQLLHAPIREGGSPIDDDRRHRIRFDTSDITALQPDKALLTQIATGQAEFASFNERRVLVGLEPSDDPEADKMPWQRTPAPAPDREQGEDSDADAADESEADEAADRAAGKAEAKARPWTWDQRKLRWQVFESKARADEVEWELSVMAQLQNDRQAAVRLARLTLREEKRADPMSVRELVADVMEKLQLERHWEPIVSRLVLSTGRKGVQDIAAEVGIRFDLLQPGLLEFVERESAWLVKGIVTTTRTELASSLRTGLEHGESIDSLVKRIREAGTFARSRAELIARTEVTRVTNGAQRETLSDYSRQSQTRITKEWLSARDDRVRPEHEELDGTKLDIDATFANGLKEPGEPNCRCTLVYAVEGS